MFVYGLLVMLYCQNVDFKLKLVEFLCGYLIYQWVKNKVSNWLNSGSLLAGDGVVQTQLSDTSAPSVDIIMLSITMIQTIHNTYQTEYELKSLLTQLREQNVYLKENFEDQRQNQMEERERLEYEKINMERMVRGFQQEVDCLERIQGTSFGQETWATSEDYPEVGPTVKQTFFPGSKAKGSAELRENIVNTCGDIGDNLDVVVADPQIPMTGEGDCTANDQLVRERVNSFDDLD